jgi:hypothetical protein
LPSATEEVPEAVLLEFPIATAYYPEAKLPYLPNAIENCPEAVLVDSPIAILYCSDA